MKAPSDTTHVFATPIPGVFTTYSAGDARLRRLYGYTPGAWGRAMRSAAAQ
jgi:hypothetical protein